MVDNRSAGFFGVGGAFNFKSGDISGTAAKMQDDKMGGNEYFGQGEQEDEQNQNNEPYVDRSAQLRATLNSLAMMNVANVLNSMKRADFLDEKNSKDEKKENSNEEREEKDELDEEFLNDFDEDKYDESDAENEYY